MPEPQRWRSPWLYILALVFSLVSVAIHNQLRGETQLNTTPSRGREVIMVGRWSRLVRFVAEDGNVYCGQPVNQEIDVGLAFARGEAIRVQLLSSSSVLDNQGRLLDEYKHVKTVGQPFTAIVTRVDCGQLLPPLSVAETGTIRCVGLNYKDHAAEMKFDLPTHPEIFLKPGSSLCSATDTIELPKIAAGEVDAEVELAVVIGRDCKNVRREDALKFVLGYTIANDVTARDVQRRGSQWSYCKGFDGFCPLGPTLVSANTIPNPSVLHVGTTLNGQTMQSQNVSDMIFTIGEIIEYLSAGSTLRKGTVILTGTPAGIGASKNPPVYLKEGDELRVSISHGLGTLVNPIASER